MITNRPNSLFSLLAPEVITSDEVIIASAYVSPAACEQLDLRSIGVKKCIFIVIGRAVAEGLIPTDIQYFIQLDKLLSLKGGGVRIGKAPFHSKLYITKKGSKSKLWIGSSNCTLNGLKLWHEANIEVADSKVILEAVNLCRALFKDGRSIKTVKKKQRVITSPGSALSYSAAPDFPTQDHDTFELSLLDRNGNIPEKSGLNWWNGAGRKRNPDEAYIPIRKNALKVLRSVLGQIKRGDEIDAITHDGTKIRIKFEGSAKAKGVDPKQLSSAGDKTVLGKWILRKILRLKPNQLVTKKILMEYGRTSLTFSKLIQPDGSTLLFIDFGK